MSAMPVTTRKLARQFMIKTVERCPYLPEQADAFGAVLAELGKPVIPAVREPVHVSRQRI